MHIIRNEKVAPIKEKIFFCDNKITLDLAQFYQFQSETKIKPELALAMK